jgi:hypothetical protein
VLRNGSFVGAEPPFIECDRALQQSLGGGSLIVAAMGRVSALLRIRHGKSERTSISKHDWSSCESLRSA